MSAQNTREKRRKKEEGSIHNNHHHRADDVAVEEKSRILAPISCELVIVIGRNDGYNCFITWNMLNMTYI